MKERQSSTTAQGIAGARALESSKPAGERICYDPLARQFVSTTYWLVVKLFAGYGERRAPGVMGFLVARARYIDDTLQACLDAGIAQLVILGAGLDSRAYRFEGIQGRVKVFEVDHPATQRDKLARLQKVFGEVPAHVTYVPIDFNVESLQKLFAHGYDPQLKTLFIWEGVAYYLQAEAVDATLEFVARTACPGSSIVFDYVYAEALTAARRRHEVNSMQRYRRFTGEGLDFGIPEGQIEEFLRRRGFEQIVNATAADLHRMYFAGANASRAVSPIYAIARATVAGGAAQ